MLLSCSGHAGSKFLIKFDGQAAFFAERLHERFKRILTPLPCEGLECFVGHLLSMSC